MLLYYAILYFVSPTNSLIGFDCGGQHLNVTAISLLDVGECDLQIREPNATNVYIELLQLSDYNYADVIQCKVEVFRTIQYCGMHSHISAVNNGIGQYIQETGFSVCKKLFDEGTMGLGHETYLQGIKPNQTTFRSVTLAGKIQNNGECKGVTYSDPYGTWDDVVVQGLVKITLKSSTAAVKLNAGKIILKSGTICELKDGFCLDSEDGYTYWKPVPVSSCDFHQYDILYEGPAIRTYDESSRGAFPVVYSLTTQDVTFALSKTREQALCGYTLSHTEHPKLFVLETKKGDTIPHRGFIPMDNLDIFAYMNSKFVYVEKHIRHQMNALYHNVVEQKCKLERQVITNTLSFATLQPDEFAYRLMKGPGYMAVTSGEAIHVVKCIPVEVTVRKTDKCYTELPIKLRNNQTAFLTPKSHVITRIGNERECSYELPTLYRVEDTWIQLTPEPHVRQLPPEQLKPQAALSWRYLTPSPLAVSGIYSEKDLERLREHIMFPAEKPAVLNSIARGMTGHAFDSNTMSMYNLLDEDAINKIVDSTASRIWNGFIAFGSATAGVFGIFLIIRIIKLIIDTAIHGYALHTAYGCSMHLLGAVWSSVTHLLLHLAQDPKKKRKDIEQQADNQSSPTETPTANKTTLDNEMTDNDQLKTAPFRVFEINNDKVIMHSPTYTDLNKRLNEYNDTDR